MRKIRYIWIVVLLVWIMASCRYHSNLPERIEREDSLTVFPERPYSLNANFCVSTDTLWLYQLPFTDSVAVAKDDRLVVAELDVYPHDPIDTVWVKVARDQETIGWVRESLLLKHIVPSDPISQCIHLFSNSHAIPFFLILGVFFLWFVVRAVRQKQIRLIWMNDIDSVFPITLSWLLAFSATIYNSLQQFAPETWERYYYNPSLNPFELPLILGLFLLCIWLILLVGIALLDDLFHQTTLEVAFFYLVGLLSCCIFLYIFFTCIYVYVAYACLSVYTLWCIRRLAKTNRYSFVCGACGAKMRTKGVCPHCGAMNE